MFRYLLTLFHNYRWRCWDLFIQFCTIIVEDVNISSYTFEKIIVEDVELSSYTFAQLSLKMLISIVEEVEISSYTFEQLSSKMLISLLIPLHTYRQSCWDLFLHFCTQIAEDFELSSYSFSHSSLKRCWELFLHFTHWTLKILRYLHTHLHNYCWRCWDIFSFYILDILGLIDVWILERYNLH